MTDGVEGVYQLALEGARREIKRLHEALDEAHRVDTVRQTQIRELQKIISGDTTPAGIEVARWRETEAALRAELAALRQQAEATAPSDAEIEAWEKRIEGWSNTWARSADFGTLSLIAKDAVALMLRAQRPAPAASGALRKAAEAAAAWLEHCASKSDPFDDRGLVSVVRAKQLRAALAAEPPAPSAATGVAVPEDVRIAATRINVECHYAKDLHLCAEFILSLPAAGASQPEPAAQADTVSIKAFRCMTDERDAARSEVAKLKQVIAEHELCHDKDLNVGEAEFTRSCFAFIRRKFGKCTVADELEAGRVSTRTLEWLLGENS